MLSAKKILILFAMLFAISPLIAQALYVPTPRDTQPNPIALEDLPIEEYSTTGYNKIGENENFIYYWRESFDILAVYDKRIGYLWKSGLDVNGNVTRTSQTTRCNNELTTYNAGTTTFERFEDRCAVAVDTITGTTTGPLQANSFLYFEYFSKGASDSVFASNTIYSSYTQTLLYVVSSQLQKVVDTEDQFRFTVSASRLGPQQDLTLDILVDLYLTDMGFRVEIPIENISGTALPYLSAIGVAQYMGAVGGIQNIFTVTPKDGDTPGSFQVTQVQKPMIGGYAFVPDGPGALIRFRNNSVSLSAYDAYVYGDDPSQSEQNYRRNVGTFVPFKTASVPLYGIAHGNNQAAFVAYATSGAEHMYVVSIPEENTYKYNSTHAKFNYNFRYNKLYTLDGDNPVPSIYDTINQFDIVMNYDFLAGDGSQYDYPASYVGMALRYQDVLEEKGILTKKETLQSDIGIRLDFLMADSENSIVGYRTRVATNVNNVESILRTLNQKGVKNISSGLLGFSKGGLTLGNPSKVQFDSSIGSKAAYTSLIKELSELGIDVSFQQDYWRINEEQINLIRNAAKHPAGWYARVITREEPVSVFYFSRPIQAVEWMKNQTKVFRQMGAQSFTIAGITNRLITDYTGNITSRTQAIEAYQTTFEAMKEQAKINAVKPNQYLFEYVDRFLQMDVYNSQYLIMTDTVPFLQILLQGSMELYAIYANFSFYTQTDILRMIDYNVYPSFVLTEQPSYVLTHTNSSIYYSTEFSLYEDLILAMYEQMNPILREVINDSWVNREVLTIGVILNTYASGKQIIVNYQDVDYSHQGQTIPALSARVLGGE